MKVRPLVFVIGVVLVVGAMIGYGGAYTIFQPQVSALEEQITAIQNDEAEIHGEIVRLEAELERLNLSKHPKLESVLYQLAQSETPEEFAETHGLTVVDGKVRVIIELKSEYDVISNKFNITVENSYENLVQTLVPIGILIELSNEPYVNFVRIPVVPWGDT